MSFFKNISIKTSSYEELTTVMAMLNSYGYALFEQNNDLYINVYENTYTLDEVALCANKTDADSVIQFVKSINLYVHAFHKIDKVVYKVSPADLTEEFEQLPLGTSLVVYDDKQDNVYYINRSGDLYKNDKWCSNSNISSYFIVRKLIWTDEEPGKEYRKKEKSKSIINEDLIKHTQNLLDDLIQNNKNIPIHMKYVAKNGDCVAEVLREFFSKK